MLMSLAFLVLYVFMIWGRALIQMIKDPIVPTISNILTTLKFGRCILFWGTFFFFFRVSAF